MKASSLLPAALIVGSLAYGAGAIAGTYGGTFGNGGAAGGGGGSGDITAVGDCTSGDCMSGAGTVILSGTVQFAGAVDARSTISNGGSATCFTGVTGVVCSTDEIGVAPASGTAFIAMKTSANTSQTGLSLYDSTATAVGGFRFFDSALVDGDAANKIGIFSGAKMITMLRNDDVAAGTAMFEARDNIGATGAQLFTVDGAGNISVRGRYTAAPITPTALAANTDNYAGCAGSGLCRIAMGGGLVQPDRSGARHRHWRRKPAS